MRRSRAKPTPKSIDLAADRGAEVSANAGGRSPDIGVEFAAAEEGLTPGRERSGNCCYGREMTIEAAQNFVL
jgi:hypothetical protein